MRRALVPVAFLLLLILLACQPKTANLVPEAVVADEKSAFVIMDDLPLWALAQGALTFKESIPIGEKLTLLGQTAKATQSGRQRDFVQVRRSSGTEGWVRAEYVASKAILGVVTTDDAILYSAPDNTAAGTSTIPQTTILAIDVDTGGMTFIRVNFYDSAAKAVLKDVYLRNEGVSSKPDDIQAAILLQLAAGSNSPRQQEAFLSSAIKDHPGSIFLPQLQAALTALTAPTPAPPASPASKATEPASGFMVTAEDAVVVFDAPDETAAKQIAALQKGQTVEIQEKTSDTYTIDGKTAPWYRIKNPAGWVFGAFLAAPTATQAAP